MTGIPRWVKKLDEDIRKYQSTQKYKNWLKKQEARTKK